MNTIQAQETAATKWWQSSNFWNQIITLVAAGFLALGVDFPSDAAQQIVGGAFAVFAGTNVIFHVAKDWDVRGKFTDIFKSSNFRTNALTILAGFIPLLPITELETLFGAIIGGKLELILIAAFNLANILYKRFWKKDPPVVATLR